VVVHKVELVFYRASITKSLFQNLGQCISAQPMKNNAATL
jgi:hypothetical protein